MARHRTREPQPDRRGLAQGGEDGYAWELAVNLAPFYEARGYLDHWARTHRKALTAVRRSGHLLGQAALLASLGSLHLNRRNLPEARRSLTTAVGLFEELGHTKGARAVPPRPRPAGTAGRP